MKNLVHRLNQCRMENDRIRDMLQDWEIMHTRFHEFFRMFGPIGKVSDEVTHFSFS